MNGNGPSFAKYAGRIACSVGALIVGVLIVTVGLWKTISIIAFAIAGYFIGSVFDDKESLRRIVNKYLGKL